MRTSWHTQWTPNPAALPQQISIGWGERKATVTGLVYTPRRRPAAGRIGRYQVRVSFGGAFRRVAARGTWANTRAAKTVTFPPLQGVTGIRLRCLSEAKNRGPICVAADIKVIGFYEDEDDDSTAADPGSTDTGSTGTETTGTTETTAAGALSRDGWHAVVDSAQVRDGAFHPGSHVLDGKPGAPLLMFALLACVLVPHASGLKDRQAHHAIPTV